MTRSIATVTWVDVDLWETAGLMYSSRPRCRCAFCIVVLGELGCAAVCVDQGEGLSETFAVAQGRHTSLVGLFDVVDLFAGLPAGDVSKTALPKHPIEQPAAA
jgi:hypothetical protein